MRRFASLSLLPGLLKGSASFMPSLHVICTRNTCPNLKNSPAFFATESDSPPEQTVVGGKAEADNDAGHDEWNLWAAEHGVVAPKISVRAPLPDERGKGGVHASEPIGALEVVARIPRGLVVSAVDAPPRAMEAAADANEFSWAADLTAAALAALHPSESELQNKDATAKRDWIGGWRAGGWATDGSDLGPPEADWGPKCVTGSLMATGSDNDHNIYAKFRFPCHPVLHRAGLGLAMLTGADKEDSLKALIRRGKTYRSMRDALLPLVLSPTERKGSLRERRAWDVADVLSKVLSRAATLQLPGEGDDSFVVVPLHERLAHCDVRGENTRLIASDDEVMLVATRAIEGGEAITRDYRNAPRLDGDISEGAMRLLLQFGLPPSAWEVA